MGRALLILNGQEARRKAADWIKRAPINTRVTFQGPKRSIPQNDKMWALLSDIARAKPMGRVLKSEGWKALFMDMIDKKPSWEPNLDGTGVVCIGYKSSHLTVAEMSDLIEQISAFGAEHDVRWSDEPQQNAA